MLKGGKSGTTGKSRKARKQLMGAENQELLLEQKPGSEEAWARDLGRVEETRAQKTLDTLSLAVVCK